jgi:hypothetical protein
MRRLMAVLSLGLCASLLPAESRAAGLDLKFGGFFPETKSSLFNDDTALYRVSKSDWDGFTGGVEGNFILARNIELGLGIEGYGQRLDTEYRDYERDNGSPIFQTLKLETLPFTASIRFVPTSRRAKIAPYIAVGGDFILWRYQEYGDFVDFSSPSLPVIADSFESSGGTFGLHGAAGLRVSVNEDISIVGEGKYTWAKENDMGEDFRGLELDLSGWTATVGMHIRF